MTGVALVTGAARGIGAATARRLADDGWTVVAVDRAADDPRLGYALGTRAELDAVAGDRMTAVVADAADADALAAVVADAETRFGGVDAVVAAAGVMAGGAVQSELSTDAERAVLDGCLGTALATARAGVPALRRRPAGRFVAVSSAGGLRGLPLLAAYCAAKAGVLGLVRALAVELRGTAVTANAVCPGSTRTAMLDETARLYGLPGAEAFAAQQPVERLLEPEEVAALIAWLVGPQAAAVTGAALPVDGGLSV